MARRNTPTVRPNQQSARPATFLDDLKPPADTSDPVMKLGPALCVQKGLANLIRNAVLSRVPRLARSLHALTCHRGWSMTPEDRGPAPFPLDFSKGAFDPRVALAVRGRAAICCDPIRHDMDMGMVRVVMC